MPLNNRQPCFLHEQIHPNSVTHPWLAIFASLSPYMYISLAFDNNCEKCICVALGVQHLRRYLCLVVFVMATWPTGRLEPDIKLFKANRWTKGTTMYPFLNFVEAGDNKFGRVSVDFSLK